MRNFKLLLATTAILSATFAVGAMAEGEAPITAETYGNRATATLNASINILSPITMTDGDIKFPTITTTNMNSYDEVKVKVNYDGTIDYAESTAQIVNDNIANSYYVTPIQITGGHLSNLYQSEYTAGGANAAALDESHNFNGRFGSYNVSVAETIPMYTLNNYYQLTNTQCGEVSALERYWNYDTSLNGGKGGLKLRFGGTFTLDGNYTPTTAYERCQGSTTVTFIFVD